MYHYLDIISLNEFEQILLLYDMILDRKEALKLLLFLRHNRDMVYEIDKASQIAEHLIYLSHHHISFDQALDLIIYFYALNQKKT
ncbi:MAG: hypothetical protein J6P61_06485 [Erysipelotrichaceae bacterium]|nr:hypothetical protein [Erysipelotrichaceae bacterium]